MTHVLTNAEKIRRLPWHTAFSSTNTVFALLTYFGPGYVLFLNELDFSNTHIGLLLSFVPFSALVALVIAPWAARFGYKRTWVTFFGMRKVMTIGLLFVPWVLAEFGPQVLAIYVTVVVALFALSRAIAETAYYPWVQEFIPNSIRGRYAAINDIVGRLTGIASIALASYILGLSAGLDRFMLLFVIALVFGFISVWSSSHIPGGAPARDRNTPNLSHRQFADVLRDRNFVRYVTGLGILLIGLAPMASFLPLFMERQVGLSESHIVLLQIGSLVGGLFSTYFVGWAADRYGSKPVMLSGLSLRMTLPLAWMLMPRHSEWSLPVAVLIAVVQGIADISWAIGSARLLYVRVVPPDKGAQYMAVYYATVGLIEGISQLAGGRILDFTQGLGLSGQFLIFPIDPFFPLFAMGLVLLLVSLVIFSRVQADGPISVSEFIGLFTHGNPLRALEWLFFYYRARDERQTVVMTERLARTKSPLTVEELLAALKDPRFNVRFEAVISIARMDSDPRLVGALCDILDGTELSLSVIAAWALGRMGDKRALDTLRRGLDSPYRSIQAHCARSLGTLGDASVASRLLERLAEETDKGLLIAFSSTLGNLRTQEAIGPVLTVLESTENEGARLELALALSRIVGHEHHFIRLLRRMGQDKGTAISQDVMALKRHMGISSGPLYNEIAACADAFARDDYENGITLLIQVIRLLPEDSHTPPGREILAASASALERFRTRRSEYLILALHTLHAAIA